MPSPSTPPRPSNRGGAKSTPARSKAFDIGKSQGPYDTTNVREKIRKWQSEGGGVVIAPDVGASSEEEQKPPKVKPQQSPQSPKRPRTRRRPEVSTRIPQNDAERRSVMNSSTPKKRVISDGHWRKNRSPPNSVSTASSPRKRMESTSTKYDQTKALFEERIERAKKERAKRESGEIQLDDSIKVYAGPLKPSKQSKLSREKTDRGSSESSSGDLDDSLTRQTSPVPRKKRSPKRRSTKDHPRRKVSVESCDRSHKDNPANHETDSNEPDDIPGSPERKRQPQSPKRRKKPSAHLVPPKGGIFGPVIDAIDGSKKFFAKPEPFPEPVRGSKVEAWLSATPDSFAEEQTQSAQKPGPMKSSSKRCSTPKSDGSDSGHRTPPSDETTSSGRRKKSRKSRKHRGSRSPPEKRDSIKKDDESLPRPPKIPSRSREQSPNSDSGLRRSGARKRTNSMYDTKISTLRESIDEALRHSNPDRPCSSDGSEVSYMDRPPPLTLRRPFPATGMHKLSTIPSVDTLATSNDSIQAPTERDPRSRKGSRLAVQTNLGEENLESESRDQFDTNSLLGQSTCGLKRRLTRHSDLMSVLSAPGRTRSIRSARSIRTSRSRLATATVNDLMRELSADEARYMRELRTLVGGVIPVLLTSVLSKTDSAVAAGLFRPSANPKDNDNFTRPIINMGVALERLKALHKRIPLDNSDALLTWAQGAKKIYADYLKAWRLGFQDVVVNLAPPDPDDPNSQNADAQSLWEGMSQDENGDVVDGDGERVDVAFLLKRPLVRLKYLSKTFKGLNYIQSSPKAEEVSISYQTLVIDARRRANEERARLEDDAAAAIDATKCRDLRTLDVLDNTIVDDQKRVKARDFFDLSLVHSTGQQIDCRSELLLRDNPPEKGPGGDLFISEVDHKGRWLLFPPIDRDRVSARRGEDNCEIVIMVRESPGEKEKWHELLSFKTDEDDICLEWVEMLGMNPLPPKIDHNRITERTSQDQETSHTSSAPISPAENNEPIGKDDSLQSRQSSSQPPLTLNISTISRGRSRMPQPKVVPPSTPSRIHEARTTGTLNEPMDLAGGGSPTSLKRTKAQRKSKSRGPASPQTPTSPAPKSTPERFYKQQPAPETDFSDHQPISLQADTTYTPQGQLPIASVVRPTRRSLSPVPSSELPRIPRLRARSQTTSALSSSTRSGVNAELDLSDEEDPVWPEDESPEDAPAPPPHRTLTQSSKKSRQSDPLVLSPPAPGFARHRRTSSPLKHEYEPSTATESSPSETSTVERHEIYSESETSDDELEDEDIITPLPPVRGRHGAISQPLPDANGADDTVARSSSVSQTPYGNVPTEQTTMGEAVAAVWYWNADTGQYRPLKSGCRIVVTPGLVEAFDTSSANPDDRPLISLELTPLVTMRRGTGVDVLVRSYPTERSTFKPTGETMFRPSNNPEDANKLYNMINDAKKNNPTYIAMQNARGPFSSQSDPPGRQNSFRSSRTGGWFSWGGLSRRNSYRASAIAPSARLSESSVGTMSSAFSALKKFGSNNKMFNIARSTLRSRTTGSRGGSHYSTSTRSGDDSSSSRPVEASQGASGGIGLSNAKIRLYVRESQKKWHDLGRARLTILPVTPESARSRTSAAFGDADGDQKSPENGASAHERSNSSSPPATPAPIRNPVRDEKRILIHSKRDGALLLDECLGESCFERIARTGIAVSVWEEFDEVAKEGGVVGGCFRVYMIQMKNEAETAYTFNLVGKNRY